MGGMNMAAPHSLALEVKVHAPHSSESHHRKAINHPSCVPSFHINPVFTLPASKVFYQCVTKFQVCDHILRTPNVWTRTVPPEEDLATLLPFAGQCQESGHKNVHGFAVYGKTEQKTSTKTDCAQPVFLPLCS